jgi:uncharacterized protein YkwD
MATTARTSGTLLRTAVALAGAAVLLTAAPAPALPRVGVPAGYDAPGTARLLSLVNAHRASIGLRALAVHPGLTTIAQGHTARMAATGRCEHNDALFTRATHTALGITVFGENVALNDTLDGAHAALLKSPLHRQNIENPAFAVAGFAVVVDAKGLVWVTEDFGTPPRTAAPVAAALPAPRAPAPRPAPRTQAAPRVRTPLRTAARPAAKPARPAPARPAAPKPSALARPATRMDRGGAATSVRAAVAAPAAVPGHAATAAAVPAGPGAGRTLPAALALALLLLATLGVVTAPRRGSLRGHPRAVPARLGA